MKIYIKTTLYENSIRLMMQAVNKIMDKLSKSWEQRRDILC